MSDIQALMQRIAALEERFNKAETREHTHLFSSLGPPTYVQIKNGEIVITRASMNYEVETEGAAATDDLDTITGGVEGDILMLKAFNGAHDVVCKDGTDNLRMPADMTLDATEDIEYLYYDGANWCEITGSSNV